MPQEKTQEAEEEEGEAHPAVREGTADFSKRERQRNGKSIKSNGSWATN